MIMTNNTFWEGYQKLTKHFAVDPRVADEAMQLAAQFCGANVCHKCLESAGCRDCKGLQPSEYKRNSGELDGKIHVEKEPIPLWVRTIPKPSKKRVTILTEWEKGL